MPFMATHQNHRSKGYGAEILRVVELVSHEHSHVISLYLSSINSQVHSCESYDKSFKSYVKFPQASGH